ncbi:hypothetical protein C0989_003297 [Termitomyces sp. Mn162]|nr:hypothetical protein C0989_003297 [Termitomyces sp. Mn162]
MPLRPVPMPQFPRDSPWAPGRPDPLFPPTPLVPRPPRCLIPPPTPTISDPQTLEDPLPLNGPQDPPRVVWVKTPVEDHPMADPREDGAWRWTTFPPSAETEITTTTTTTPDPHLKLKIHRTIPVMHWPGRAYKTGWNYNALQFALHRALPQWIKDILHLAPKQTTYDRYKALITQVDQCYWEDHSKNTAPWTSWNASSNTNWQAGATNGIRSSIPTNPANPAPCFPPGQGVPNTN